MCGIYGNKSAHKKFPNPITLVFEEAEKMTFSRLLQVLQKQPLCGAFKNFSKLN